MNRCEFNATQQQSLVSVAVVLSRQRSTRGQHCREVRNSFLHGLDRPPAAHYRFGAAGCVFGFVATAGTSFFLGAITAFLSGRDTTIWTRMVVLLGGPPVMAMSGGIAFSILFWKEILLAGAAFGLFNTWIARRMHQ
jgi:hypothetical protein